MIETLCVFLLVYASLVTWVCINQLKRCEKLTDIANNVVANMEKLSGIIEESDKLFSNSVLKTAFANDDETGTFFKNMQEIQELLNNFVLHGKETQQEQP